MRFLAVSTLALALSACIHVKLDPVEVHAVLDVNVKVDREVTDLLSDIYGNSKTVNAPVAAK